jgi:hypothetical protein
MGGVMCSMSRPLVLWMLAGLASCEVLDGAAEPYDDALAVVAPAQPDDGSPSLWSCADPDDAAAPHREVSGTIDRDTLWHCDEIVVLTDVVVVRGAVLTIESGTTVWGERGSALVVEADARLEAIGAPESPIVMGSAQAPALRRAGDWGGLTLHGSDDAAHRCGTLQHVRIEWAGAPPLSSRGCGSETVIEDIGLVPPPTGTSEPVARERPHVLATRAAHR